MIAEARKPSRAHLPQLSYVVFVLIIGMMTGLAIWSLISSSKVRSASEDQDARGRLQTELRALVGAPPIPAAPANSAGPTYPNSTATQVRGSWKWLGFIFLVGAAFTLWAVINYYAASEAAASSEELADGPEVAAPPLVVIPDWMKTAVRAASDGIATLDAAGRILTVNPSAEQALGYGIGRLAGREIFEVVADLGKGSEDLRRFSQVSAPTEVTASQEDGSAARLKLALHRVAEKGPAQYVAVFARVPETLAAEKKTEALAVPAVTPVNEDAIHDLENQIVMIGGYNEMILEALPEESEIRADAEAMGRAAARASLLCHEVAPIAQAHPCLLDLNQFAIAVTRRLAQMLDPGCEVKALPGDVRTEVWADPDLLERSLNSLAWRTQEWAGGLTQAVVTVSGGRLELRMTPAGQGARATRAAFGNLLAIDWIEKQNGTIEMEEQSETGVRFRIWLPAAAQARLPQSAKAAAPAAKTSRSHAAD